MDFVTTSTSKMVELSLNNELGNIRELAKRKVDTKIGNGKETRAVRPQH
jgi:hypothetical protein